MVYDASVPSTEVAVDVDVQHGTGGRGRHAAGRPRASIYLTQVQPTAAPTWITPTRLAPEAIGHQFFPDINADGGRLFAIWHDSRNDPGLQRAEPAGQRDGQGRERASTCHRRTRHLRRLLESTAAPPGRRRRLSTRSADAQLRDVRRPAGALPRRLQLRLERGRLRLRHMDRHPRGASGDDPRYEGGEGFDVFQCRTAGADGTFGPDTCPNAGGLDQDIYGAGITP